MKSSLITKKRIAKSLKQLMKQKEFEQISITEIMKLSEIRRQTFYTYFLDKYELLEWIFENELKEQVSDNLDYVSSNKLIEQLILFFTSNQNFYQKLFELDGQNNFKDFFAVYCETVIEKYLQDHREYTNFSDVSQRNLFIQYHSRALAETLHYVLQSNEIDIKMVQQTITNILFGSLMSWQKK